MRFPALLFAIAVSSTCIAQVYRFGEPKGTGMHSVLNHIPSPDRFGGVKPVVMVGKAEMTVIWGDSGGGNETAWKAKIVHRSSSTISGITTDIGTQGSAVMLFTIDTKRGFLYMSSHKEGERMNGSSASSFVAKLEK